MPSAEEIRTAVDRYVRLMNAGDADAIAALYAEDGTVEDPIGAPPQRGRAAILAFYRAAAGKVELVLTGPIRVAGSEAAFPMLGTLATPAGAAYIDIIDVMKFDAAGRIASMRAFWSADAIRRG